MQILNQRNHVVILDSKRTISPIVNGVMYYKRVESFADVLRAQKSQRILYAPNHEELDLESPGMFDRLNDFFRFIFERGNTTLYVDEVFLTLQNGRRRTHFYHAIMSQGREFQISLFTGTQRPMDIPQPIMSESEYFYTFRLQMPGDREKIENIIDLSTEKIKALRPHQFYFADVDRGVIIGPRKIAVPDHRGPGQTKLERNSHG